jgi:peroxiredoxin
MEQALQGLLIVLVMVTARRAEEQLGDKPMKETDSPVEEYRALAREYQDAEKAYVKSSREKRNVLLTPPDWRKYAAQMMALAENHPTDPAAVDALVWVTRYSRSRSDGARAKAMVILARDHVTSDKIIGMFQWPFNPRDRESQTFLRLLMEKNPSKEIQGRACLCLAESLQAPLRFDRTGQPATGPKLNKEIESLLERAVSRYGDVREPFYGTVGRKAEGLLFEGRSLLIGKDVPDIDGKDQEGKSFKLSDYRGKVILLSFFGDSAIVGQFMYQEWRSLVKEYEGKPFALVGVNSDEKETLRQLIKGGTITWRSFWDGGSDKGPISVKWNISPWPTLYLIDAKGIIRQKWAGTQPYAQVDQAIKRLITEAEAGTKLDSGGGQTPSTN